MSFVFPQSRRHSSSGLIYRGRGLIQEVDASPVLFKISDGFQSRASTAWWVSDDGTEVLEFPAGYPRLVNGYVVIEGPVNNLIDDNPKDITTTGGWAPVDVSGDYTVDRNAGVAPDGTTTAARHNFGANFSDRVSTDNVGGLMVANATYVFEVWARTESGTKNFRISLTNGVGGQITSGHNLATTTWQRFTFESTMPASPVAANMRAWLYNASTADAGSVLFWGATCQYALDDLHPAPVLEASATKPLDVYDFNPSIGEVPQSFFDDGFVLVTRPYYAASEHITQGNSEYLIDWNTSNAQLLLNNGSSTFRFRDTAGTIFTTGSCAWNERDIVTHVVDFDELMYRVLVNGVLDEQVSIGPSSSVLWDAASAYTQMRIGAETAAGSAPAYVEFLDNVQPISESSYVKGQILIDWAADWDSYSRAGEASYMFSETEMRWAPAGVLRDDTLDYRCSENGGGGVFLESASTNLLTDDPMDQRGWAVSGATRTDGTSGSFLDGSTPTEVTWLTGAGSNRLIGDFTGAASTDYIISAYVRAKSGNPNIQLALFDDITGVQKGSVETALVGEWLRFDTIATTGAGSTSFEIRLYCDGSGVGVVEVSGFQVEIKPSGDSAPTSLIRTAGATRPVDLLGIANTSLPVRHGVELTYRPIYSNTEATSNFGVFVTSYIAGNQGYAERKNNGGLMLRDTGGIRAVTGALTYSRDQLLTYRMFENSEIRAIGHTSGDGINTSAAWDFNSDDVTADWYPHSSSSGAGAVSGIFYPMRQM